MKLSMIPTPARAQRARRNISEGPVPYAVPITTRRNSGRETTEELLIFGRCPMEVLTKVHDAVLVANDALYRAYGPQIGALVTSYSVVGHPRKRREVAS